MKKEDLKIGSKYTLSGSVCKLIGFDGNNDPILSPINGCEGYLKYDKRDVLRDNSLIEGCYGYSLHVFIEKYTPVS